MKLFISQLGSHLFYLFFSLIQGFYEITILSLEIVYIRIHFFLCVHMVSDLFFEGFDDLFIIFQLQLEEANVIAVFVVCVIFFGAGCECAKGVACLDLGGVRGIEAIEQFVLILGRLLERVHNIFIPAILSIYVFLYLIVVMKGAITVLKQEDKSILLQPQIARYSLIWLHGLGDTSAGFLDYFDIPISPAYHGARVKLLHAPIQPVTINGGMSMPSWYDIKTLGFDQKRDEDKCSLDQVKSSMEILNKKVQEEAEYWRNEKVDGDVYKRIFVGGFSQGCAISLFYGLTTKVQLGGIIGFSGYLFNFEGFQLSNLGKVPVLLNHGTEDMMINFGHAKKSYERILNPDNKVTFRQKELYHEVNMEQLKQMNAWLQNLTSEFKGKE